MRTWVFAEQALADSVSLHPAWNADPVDNLVLDTDGSRFACDWVRRDIPDQACSPIAGSIYFHANSTLPYATQRHCVLWYALDQLPANITIVEAKLCFFSQTNVIFPGVTRAWAVLDTLTADQRWLNGSGCDPLYPPMRAASWLRPGSPDSSAWVPALDRRDDSYDWGVKGAPSQMPWLAGGPVELDVTEPVQHFANYRHANAGFWVFSNRGTQVIALRAGRDSPDERRPFLKIRFRETPYTFPWNGHPLAFVVTTDDQDSVNFRYMQTLDSLGYKFTVYVRGDSYPFRGAPNPAKLSLAQLETIRAHGHEIGHHSLSHLQTYGIGEITPTGVDSMRAELDRGWLIAALGMQQAEVRTFAYPAGGYSTLGIRTLNEKRYLGARCAGTVGTAVPAWSDADGSGFLTWTDTCNIFAVERLVPDFDLFGLASQDTITSPTLREKLYDVINKAVDNNHAAIVFYLHDSKASPIYPHGADPDEFSWLMRHVKSHGRLWVTTFGDLLDFYRKDHVPCAPPAFAAKSRIAGVTAAEKIWWALGSTAPPTTVPEPGAIAVCRLGGNVPNPFNASTVLRYSLAQAGRVRLRVFDVRGRLLRELVNEMQDSGGHVVEWDARDSHGREAASGVYFCRLEAGGRAVSAKMLLVK